MIITNFNFKGGIAKTETTINISIGLKAQGASVLAVDLSRQANLTKHFGHNDDELEKQGRTIGHSLLHGVPLANIIIPGKKSYEPDIVPSSMMYEDTVDAWLEGYNPINPLSLKNALDQVRHNYDYIVIDAPPEEIIPSVVALIASDYILVINSTERRATEGLEKLLYIIRDVKTRFNNHNLKIFGVLPTLFTKTTLTTESTLREYAMLWSNWVFTSLILSTLVPT